MYCFDHILLCYCYWYLVAAVFEVRSVMILFPHDVSWICTVLDVRLQRPSAIHCSFAWSIAAHWAFIATNTFSVFSGRHAMLWIHRSIDNKQSHAAHGPCVCEERDNMRNPLADS